MVLGRSEDLAVRDLTKWLYHLLQLLREREEGEEEREREREREIEGRERGRGGEREGGMAGGMEKERERIHVQYKIFKMKINHSVCVCPCARMCELVMVHPRKALLHSSQFVLSLDHNCNTISESELAWGRRIKTSDSNRTKNRCGLISIRIQYMYMYICMGDFQKLLVSKRVVL